MSDKTTPQSQPRKITLSGLVKSSLVIAISYSILASLLWPDYGIDSLEFENHNSHPRYLKRKGFGTEHIRNQSLNDLGLVDKEIQSFLNQSARHLKEQNQAHKCNQERIRGGPTTPGSFLPIFVGRVNSEEPSFTMSEGNCFKRIEYRYEQTIDVSTGEISEIRIHIDPKEPSSKFCYEWIAIFTHQFQEFESLYLASPSVLTFKNLPAGTIHDVRVNGVRVYMFCNGYLDTLSSVWNFAKMYLGGLSTITWLPFFGSHVPAYQEKANIEFMRNTMQWNLEERAIKEYEYDESHIRSGDVLAIFRLDGVDQIIMYGTGATIGHCTMALWIEGELYVVEAMQNVFWPKVDVQRNKYRDWVSLAKNADYHVAHLPLNEEARQRFNETAAIEFFKRTEGLPYGFHNFLYGWIDTEHLAPIIPKGGMMQAFGIFEAVLPAASEAFITQALNKRLGTKGLKMADLAIEAAKRNITSAQLVALQEKDGWEYEGFEPRDGESYVCSSYVVALMKAAGLFGDLEIHATEFTPRDLYELNFFDKNHKTNHSECMKADPDQPFCQILGKYRMVFPNYGTIKPYNRMNEKCPSIAPDYIRLENC